MAHVVLCIIMQLVLESADHAAMPKRGPAALYDTYGNCCIKIGRCASLPQVCGGSFLPFLFLTLGYYFQLTQFGKFNATRLSLIKGDLRSRRLIRTPAQVSPLSSIP